MREWSWRLSQLWFLINHRFPLKICTKSKKFFNFHFLPPQKTHAPLFLPSSSALTHREHEQRSREASPHIVNGKLHRREWENSILQMHKSPGLTACGWKMATEKSDYTILQGMLVRMNGENEWVESKINITVTFEFPAYCSSLTHSFFFFPILLNIIVCGLMHICVCTH